MSTCISMHGEYSDHTPDENFACTRCDVLDEDALIEDRNKWRALAAAQPRQIAPRALGRVIWNASQADEGSISVMGADIVAGAVIAYLSTAPVEGEVEWEYGLVNPEAEFGQYGRDDRAHLVSRNREHIEKQWRRGHPSIQFVKRIKAGPWERVIS